MVEATVGRPMLSVRSEDAEPNPLVRVDPEHRLGLYRTQAQERLRGGT